MTFSKVSGPACYALKDRDEWIGWHSAPRAERLKLVVQNRRFLLLHERGAEPNLASKALAAAFRALPEQWNDQFVGGDLSSDPWEGLAFSMGTEGLVAGKSLIATAITLSNFDYDSGEEAYLLNNLTGDYMQVNSADVVSGGNRVATIDGPSLNVIVDQGQALPAFNRARSANAIGIFRLMRRRKLSPCDLIDHLSLEGLTVSDCSTHVGLFLSKVTTCFRTGQLLPAVSGRLSGSNSVNLPNVGSKKASRNRGGLLLGRDGSPSCPHVRTAFAKQETWSAPRSFGVLFKALCEINSS